MPFLCSPCLSAGSRQPGYPCFWQQYCMHISILLASRASEYLSAQPRSTLGYLDSTRSKGVSGSEIWGSPAAGVSGGEVRLSEADPRALAGDALLDQTMMSARKGGPGTIICSTKLKAAPLSLHRAMLVGGR